MAPVSDVMMQQNEDGTWSELVPVPYSSWKGERCPKCSESMWTIKGYEAHYKREHTTGRRYKRTSKGYVTI